MPLIYRKYKNFNFIISRDDEKAKYRKNLLSIKNKRFDPLNGSYINQIMSL